MEKIFKFYLTEIIGEDIFIEDKNISGKHFRMLILIYSINLYLNVL